MRRILFRGKTIDNSVWAYGNLSVEEIDKSEVNFIRGNEKKRTIYIQRQKAQYEPYTSEYGRTAFRCVQKRYEIDPETVGQYTGLKDKNGKRIFEGDIVRGIDHLNRGLEVFGYVGYENGSFVIIGDIMTHYRWLDYEVEIIGNTYDNPELLEVK